nr:MAG TPA: hypothetical protein [Caudoviricetes sp.]
MLVFSWIFCLRLELWLFCFLSGLLPPFCLLLTLRLLLLRYERL